MFKIPSSFNGEIYEIPEVCIDNFEYPYEDGATAYFLSHYHTDHTVGLNEFALRQKLRNDKDVYIYATKMTAAIIVYNYNDLADYVRVLNLGSNLITIPSDAEENGSDLILNVTLIPAGHCLGSTMFLFETTSVKVLYTGDFRIRSNDLSKYAAFHDKEGQIIKLDTLYVDTTFLTSHKSFPKRTDSIEEAMVLIKRFLDSNEHQYVILDISATYGYEYVFNQIHKLFGMKVYVENWRWTLYSTVQHLVPGVTNNAYETRIFLKNIPKCVTYRLPPKKIKFSAYRWEDWKEDKTSINEDGNDIYVCFSTHCSREELVSFVEYLEPAKVVGFPKPYDVERTPRKRARNGAFVLSPKNTPKKTPLLNTARGNDKKVGNDVMKKIFG